MAFNLNTILVWEQHVLKKNPSKHSKKKVQLRLDHGGFRSFGRRNSDLVECLTCCKFFFFFANGFCPCNCNTGRKLSEHKTFWRCPRCLLNVFWTSSVPSVYVLCRVGEFCKNPWLSLNFLDGVFVEILQLRAKFQTSVVLCSKFFTDHKFRWHQEGLNCKPLT